MNNKILILCGFCTGKNLKCALANFNQNHKFFHDKFRQCGALDFCLRQELNMAQEIPFQKLCNRVIEIARRTTGTPGSQCILIT